MHFQEKEKLKRLEKTRYLLSLGRTSKEIAKEFGVTESTAEEYVSEVLKGHKIKKIKKPNGEFASLDSFSGSSSNSSDSVFETKADQGGFSCPLCKKVCAKHDAKNYNSKITICKNCFGSLDASKIRELDSL